MNILIIGQGRMALAVEAAARAAADSVCALLGRAELPRLSAMGAVDVVIDFSGIDALEPVLDYVRRTATPYLSGVTGLSAAQMEAIAQAGRFAPVLHSANFSLGVAVLRQAVQQVAATLLPDFDVEIVETHHAKKADAPSGTAKLLVEAVMEGREMTTVYGRSGLCGARPAGEIGVHALRGGTVAGEHTVRFLGLDEELSLTHRATSRQIFATGACHVARLLPGRKPGVYELQNLLFGTK